MLEYILILAAIGLAVVLVKRYPDTTRAWYARFRAAKNVVYGVLAIATAWVLLMTGSTGLMLIGAAILVIIVLTAYFDGPLKGVLD